MIVIYFYIQWMLATPDSIRFPAFNDFVRVIIKRDNNVLQIYGNKSTD